MNVSHDTAVVADFEVTVVVVISHIQRIGCQPEKLLYTVANSARGLLNRGKNKSGSAPPPTCSFRENKMKIT